MSLIKNTLAFILLCLFVGTLMGQKVTVSREISVKNNYTYDVLPNISDHIIFYHDRGLEHNFEIYDNKLRYINTIQPEFEKRSIKPIGVLPMDSIFRFYYYYTDETNAFIKVRTYDKNVRLTDSITLWQKDKKFLSNSPRFAYSKDKSKVLIFTPDERNLYLQLFDNIKMKLIFEFKLIIKEINLKSDFEKIAVTNEGEIFILTRKSSFWDRKSSNSFTLARIINKENIYLHRFSPEANEISDLKMDYDEKNKRIVFAGLTTFGDDSKSNGYFGFSILPDELPDDAEILINKYTSEFIAEATGKKPGKTKELADFKLKDIFVNNEGGVIMILESVKEFTRRAQMISPTQFGDYFPSRGFIDYYHEDLLIFATHPDGKEHWKKILFKKQFSQDDGGMYSSYFLFKTPSRIRLVYNDEIKNSNTVSEYIIDPIGNAERKSVLSTEYQNLRLRFRDAIQIGPNSIIVPSEKSWKINLVRIDYE
jgi:hypothetical protein